MSYATRLTLVLAMLPSLREEVRRKIQELLQEQQPSLEDTVLKYVLNEVTPTSTFDLEKALEEHLREVGRQLLQTIFNLLESDDPEQTPHDVNYEAGGYRRLNHKTPNRHVSTLFGKIVLWRRGYRCWQRHAGEKTIFPLEVQLGLIEGATPALAEAAMRYLADAGATQKAALARMREHHGVAWGEKRLRKLAAAVSQAMADWRQEFQVRRLLELLQQAHTRRGKGRPTLSVGRDGTTLREYHYRFFENATVATFSVYDRRGKRLGTVYLAFAPQLGQSQMTKQLTALIREVLRRWEGPVPQLCYVTDAGASETTYFQKVLRPMRHPRTGQRLSWQRILDFYHAMKYVWEMAYALFGKTEGQGLEEAQQWAEQMRRLLKQPNGPSRVLHSAAAHFHRRWLSTERKKEYHQAANYLRRRTRIMQYADYRRRRLPIGSGVTEAACKTVFGQRLKLSGMRWQKKGAQTILNLRVILLSGVWKDTYRKVIYTYHSPIRAYDDPKRLRRQKAA